MAEEQEDIVSKWWIAYLEADDLKRDEIIEKAPWFQMLMSQDSVAPINLRASHLKTIIDDLVMIVEANSKKQTIPTIQNIMTTEMNNVSDRDIYKDVVRRFMTEVMGAYKEAVK